MSLPSRERGLKLNLLQSLAVAVRVAPLAGAWIETRHHPQGEGGRMVAPLAGAWIETSTLTAFTLSKPVAPLAGAWIETQTETQGTQIVLCRSPRGSVD